MTSPSITRRKTLQGMAATGLTAPLLAACGSEETEAAEDAADQATSQAPSEGGEAADQLAATADIPVGGGKVFEDQKVVVTQPTEGDFKAFSAVCTHQGCLVSEVTDTINCKCHASAFSISDGSVTGGPAKKPLIAADITVDGDSITLG